MDDSTCQQYNFADLSLTVKSSRQQAATSWQLAIMDALEKTQFSLD
jgi:hypothetical protein